MAKAKSATKKRKEPTPIDDRRVVALVERVTALEIPGIGPMFRSWFSATERQRPQVSAALGAAIVNAVRGPEIVSFLIESIGLVDEPRVLDALTILVRMIAGDHRRWLLAETFDPDAIIEDRVTSANRAAALLCFDAIVSYTKDPSAEVRARVAFVLVWFGRDVRSRSIETLVTLVDDRTPEVRANAIVSLALLGERSRVASLLSDGDERVRLAAAIAASYGADGALKDRVISTLEDAVVSPQVLWRSFAFYDGDIASFAVQRFGRLGAAFDDRVASRLSALLEGRSGPALAGAAVLAAFAGYTPGAALTRAQREVATKIIATESLQTPAVLDALREFRLVTAGQYVTIDVMLDECRERLGLPRPPPTLGPREIVALPESALPARHAQHWLADFALQPMPERAASIAEAIANTVAPDALFEFLTMQAADWDGTELPRARTDGVQFEVPLPEGLSPRGDLYAGPPEQWPTRFRVWLEDREREGWLLSRLWWYGVSVQAELFDLRGRRIELDFGHDWNAGNPTLTEVRALVRTRHRLTPLVARAARARDPAGFDRAMEATLEVIVAGGRREAWRAGFLLSIAIEVFAGAAEPPPALYDRALRLAQQGWSYVIAPFVPYARLLPRERVEALALECATDNDQPLFLLCAFARTRAVFDAIVARARAQVAAGLNYSETDRARWAWVMGDEAADALLAAVRAGRAKRR
jgi:hypothetical protein